MTTGRDGAGRGPTAPPGPGARPLPDQATLVCESDIPDAVEVRSTPANGDDALPARYVDEGEFARGGMGSVRRVADRVVLRHVAIKRLHAEHVGNPLLARLFLEEAQVTGQLDHPNIVPIHDIGVSIDGTRPFFTMKLVQGRTLAQLVDKNAPEPPHGTDLEQLLQVLLKVCDAIAFAHSRNVIHRDLKPDNIMIGTHGQVYVMDWGLALLRPGASIDAPGAQVRTSSRPHPAQQNGILAGTPSFMSPEQARGLTDKVDERSDVFGLGAILYYVLTCRSPLRDESLAKTVARAQRGDVTPLAEAAPGYRVPPGLCRITERALAPNPDDRYGSVDEFKADLEQFLRGGGWFEIRAFTAGTAIVRQGEPPDAAYVIHRGHCAVLKATDGRVALLREMGPGEAFGETALITDRPRSATVVAIDDVEVKVITREALDRELERFAWMGAIVRALAERFRDIDSRFPGDPL